MSSDDRLGDAERRDSGFGPSIPMTPETPVLPARSRERLGIRYRRPTSLFTPLSIFLLTLLLLRVFIGILQTPNILEGLLFAFIALLPAFIIGWLVLTRFRDELANGAFLFMQFLIAAIPLIILVIPAELFIAAICAAPVIINVLLHMQDELEDVAAAAAAQDEKKLQEFLAEAVQYVSLPAVIITALLIAYFSAGMVEEIGKWFVSRRFLGLECICGNDDKIVGCRGILASACMAGLGFATTENIGYVMGMSKLAKGTGGTFLAAFLGLFRGVIAVPTHVGTQLYVGIAAAQRHVFLDEVKVSIALFHAILFHGTFDAVAFVVTILVVTETVPVWLGLLVPVVDIFLVTLLLLVCRARYKALLERERVALASEPV